MIAKTVHVVFWTLARVIFRVRKSKCVFPERLAEVRYLSNHHCTRTYMYIWYSRYFGTVPRKLSEGAGESASAFWRGLTHAINYLPKQSVLKTDSVMLAACLLYSIGYHEVTYDHLAGNDLVFICFHKRHCWHMGPAKDKHGVRESFTKSTYLANNGRVRMKEFIYINRHIYNNPYKLGYTI